MHLQLRLVTSSANLVIMFVSVCPSEIDHDRSAEMLMSDLGQKRTCAVQNVLGVLLPLLCVVLTIAWLWHRGIIRFRL